MLQGGVMLCCRVGRGTDANTAKPSKDGVLGTTHLPENGVGEHAGYGEDG